MATSLNFSVSHRGATHTLTLPPTTTLSLLQTELEALTGVAPENQKLLFKGKKATAGAESTLAQAGLKDGVKVQMLGSTSQGALL
jgi:hypothetical protein